MKKLLISILLFIIVQYFYVGCSRTIPQKIITNKKENFELIAHRGVHQNYNKEGLDYLTGCTAKQIYKPTHNLLENTYASMQSAFDYGATVVEIDIRPSKDKELVVFHDWMLDCRTEAIGKVSDFLLKDLKKLDVGYGYTHNDGKTYPFRGQGVGKMKTLFEVLSHFPNKKFLIDNKSGDNLEVAQLIVDVLLKFPKERHENLYIWSSDKSYDYIKKNIPSLRRLTLPKEEQKSFYKSYILSLGLMGLPEKYQGEGIGLTPEYTKFIWGWSYRFLNKVYVNDTRFYMYLNTKEEFDNMSDIPIDGIITDYIEVVGEK